jgi:hypothetical protein
MAAAPTQAMTSIGLGQLCRMLPEMLGAQPITLSAGMEILTLDETEPAQLIIKRVMNRRTRHRDKAPMR